MLLEHKFNPAVPIEAGYPHAREYLNQCGFICSDDDDGLKAEVKGRQSGKNFPISPQLIRLGFENGQYRLAYLIEERRLGTVGRTPKKKIKECREWMLLLTNAIEEAVNEGTFKEEPLGIIKKLKRKKRISMIIAICLLGAVIVFALLLTILAVMQS